MKNKKLMLIAIGAMGFVALGAGGVATAAWYTASSAATINRVGDSSTISTESASQTVGAYYAKAKFAAASYTVTQTDAAGNCWVIVGGYLQPATPGANGKYASSVITLKFYSDADCTVECTAAQYKEIGTSYDSIQVTVAATGRVRVTTANPSGDNFATAFSGKLGANYTFTAAIAADGTLSANTSTAYISVFGQTGDDATLEAGAGGGTLEQYVDGGTVTTTCAAPHARS